MKNNIIIRVILSFFSLASLASCNDLDQSPTNRFNEDKFWQTKERAQMMLNTAYSQMFSTANLWTDEMLSGNMIPRKDRGWDEYLIRSGQGAASTGLFRGHWSWLYTGIKTTNVFLANVDKVPGLSEDENADMKAQARFIRAQNYFRATMLYGDIPFFLTNISLEESKTMPRTSRATVMAELHRELNEITPLLPIAWTNETKGRIRRAAAAMLQARIYLFENNFAKVAEITKEIMDGKYGSFALYNPANVTYSAYEDLFTTAAEYNNEIILCYSMISNLREWSLMDVVPRSCVGSRGAYNAPTENLVSNYVDLDGNEFVPSTGSNYENRDPRLDATVVRHGSAWRDVAAGKATSVTILIDPSSSSTIDKYKADNATETGYYLRKWFDPAHRENMYIATNPILMRYADVLLMYAEAKNELGQMSEEVWNATIAPIRARAGFKKATALNYPTLNKEPMRTLLRRERRSELAIEGLFLYDLLRWKAAENILNGSLTSAKYTAATTPEIIFIYNFKANRDYLWAVPQAEIDNWKALLPQNPGY